MLRTDYEYDGIIEVEDSVFEENASLAGGVICSFYEGTTTITRT